MTSPHLLLADSGSTKTDWVVGDLRVKTQGINPFHQDEETILAVLWNELRPQLSVTVDEIRFYGSGVRPELEGKMERLLRMAFPSATSVSARSDMLGAAHALCGHDEGIACILGTGANSCLYDGQAIVANTPPLGYVLGDEGSGAVLGREFLNALYKGRLYEGAQEEFAEHFGMSLADVVARVYRQPLPNRWLASLSEYINRHVSQPSVRSIVVDNFRLFISRNIHPYHRHDLHLSAVGSIAYFYQDELREAAAAEGYAVGKILRSPLDGWIL